MAKKRAEDAPPSLLWKDTFSDLMNLLLCFFVLLFSMSTVDADKFQELAASLASAFSVLPSGGSTIKSDGILVGSGASQLNELSDYYNNMGMNSEGDVELDKESNTAVSYTHLRCRRKATGVDLGGRRIIKKKFFSSRRRHTRYLSTSRGLGDVYKRQISDVLMPGCSGFELTRKLKNDFNTSHIPIILLTALNSQEKHLEGVEAGADAYITKPFSSSLLRARVFKLIEQRDRLREKFSKDPHAVRPAICTTDRDKEFADKLAETLGEHLSDPDFTIDEFASIMGLGRTVFYRKVKGVTGYSPNEYIRVMRMKKAVELLAEGKYTVAEVTYQIGMNDPFYFSKCFKAQFGVPPSSYLRGEKEE